MNTTPTTLFHIVVERKKHIYIRAYVRIHMVLLCAHLGHLGDLEGCTSMVVVGNNPRVNNMMIGLDTTNIPLHCHDFVKEVGSVCYL